METGKIKKWFKDKGFGFIVDELGKDVFFHISGSQELRGKEESLVEGAIVVFDKRPSSRHKGQYEAKSVRLQNRTSGSHPVASAAQEAVESSSSSAEIRDHFHNPYTFVPSPPRQDAISASGFSGDFDPLEHDLSHESLKPDLWTGHLPVKLTTVTPLVLPKTEGEERSSDKHQTYDILNHLPESSLRGMLRSAYEVVTNSRYSCFKNDEQLAYRLGRQKTTYEKSPEDLLDSSLKPTNKRNELSPSDRLFGWVPQKSGNDQGYKGRIRVVCEDDARPEIIEDFAGEPLSLAILGQPKPAQGRFYVAKNDQGMPQEDGLGKQQAGYSKGKGLRGRKQYWHHKGLEASQAPDYWKPSVEDRTQQQSNGRHQEYRRPDQNGKPQNDPQNRSITGWIKPDTVFKASLYVQNLQVEEVGALLWLLSLPEGHFFRLGYGKPLGFGSVRVEIDENRCANGCLPLGTGADWNSYYATFDSSSPATLGEEQLNDCIQKFKASMVAAYDPLPVNDETIKSVEEPETSASRRLTSLDDLKSVQLFTDPEDRIEIESEHFKKLPFIGGFLQVLSGPRRDAPIHYPRLERKPNPEGENFKWFVDNEKGQGKKVTLPSVIGEKGLPYQPSSRAVHSSHTRRRR